MIYEQRASASADSEVCFVCSLTYILLFNDSGSFCHFLNHVSSSVHDGLSPE